MHKVINKKRIIMGIVLSSIMFVGCNNQETSINAGTSNNGSEYTKVEQNENTLSNSQKEETDLLTILNNAREIEVKEKLISLGSGYNVYADGIHIGEIQGKYVNVTGDVFELKDLNGNIVKSEKQIKRWNIKLNRMAEVYDKNNNVSGYIGEEKIKDMFSFGYKFHFYDKNKNEIGYTSQKMLSFTDTFNVYDMENNLDYAIEGELVSLTSSYVIEVNDTSNIKPEDVVFYTAIQNEITRSDKKKSESNTKKVSNVVGGVVAAGLVNNVTNNTKNSSNGTNTSSASTNKSSSVSQSSKTNNKSTTSTSNNNTSKSTSTKKSGSSNSIKNSTTAKASSSSNKKKK